MAFDLDELYGQGVAVAEDVAKGALTSTPQRIGGGWVRPLIQRFDADDQDFLFLPVSAFPARGASEKSEDKRAKNIAQQIRTAARDDLRVDVNARAVVADEELAGATGLDVGTVGVILTHEYPEKSNRGRRPAGESA